MEAYVGLDSANPNPNGTDPNLTRSVLQFVADYTKLGPRNQVVVAVDAVQRTVELDEKVRSMITGIFYARLDLNLTLTLTVTHPGPAPAPNP